MRYSFATTALLAASAGSFASAFPQVVPKASSSSSSSSSSSTVAPRLSSTATSSAAASTGSAAIFTAAPKLPVESYNTPKFAQPLSLNELLNFVGKTIDDVLQGKPVSEVPGLSKVAGIANLIGRRGRRQPKAQPVAEPAVVEVFLDNETDVSEHTLVPRAQCANPRIRREWDSYSTSDRRAFTDALRCLMTRSPSGQFGQSRSRYEDLVALHQTLTPNVHGNHKFLLWHRYYLWTFEQILRSECGFNRELPWFDETRYAGRFAQSSVFSSDNFGSVDIGGQCVTNGQFANLAINVGPGSGNTRHCLARNGNSQTTANTNQAMVDGCNQASSYSQMAFCAERGAHAYGHNGIGSVMQDTYASPADPVFWLHHAFIDRNFRIWQNANAARRTTVDGTDASGNRLTLDTNINVYGMRPDVRIRDILDTTETTLCYKYNY